MRLGKGKLADLAIVVGKVIHAGKIIGAIGTGKFIEAIKCFKPSSVSPSLWKRGS
jgi:hypothetical protein